MSAECFQFVLKRAQNSSGIVWNFSVFLKKGGRNIDNTDWNYIFENPVNNRKRMAQPVYDTCGLVAK
jgi:hypothetical protein